MSSPQKLSPPKARFILHSERLGPLPLVNHFIDRIGQFRKIRMRAIHSTQRAVGGGGLDQIREVPGGKTNRKLPD